MSKKAILKLNKSHSNYSLNIELAGQDKAGIYMAKSFLQIFDPKYEAGKQPVIIKAVNSYGVGTTVNEAQEKAIEAAVDNLGI